MVILLKFSVFLNVYSKFNFIILLEFRNGNASILVATDVAARGLGIDIFCYSSSLDRRRRPDLTNIMVL